MGAIAMVREERTGGIDSFTRWCRDELFTPDMIRATALLEQACDLLLIDVYRSLDIGSMLADPRTPAEVAEALGYVDSASIAIDAMLYRLALNTSFVAGPGETGAYQARHSTIDPAPELAEIWRGFDALGPDYVAAKRFVEFGARHFDRALRDDPEFMDRILSGRETEFAQMWDDATNRDPLQDVHGIMGAMAVSTVFSGGTILELGGGTGNGVRHLLAALRGAGKLDSLDRYIFTDVGMSFILGTRREIKKEYPAVDTDWHFLDINKPFGDQRITAASVDLVYAVNAAHVAKDIVEAMKQCREVLRPGGMVILAERIRRHPRLMAPREISLNLSIYHRTAATRNSDYRPMHCYLTPANWERVLELAGFSDFMVCPNLELIDESFPQQYASVVMAER